MTSANILLCSYHQYSDDKPSSLKSVTGIPTAADSKDTPNKSAGTIPIAAIQAIDHYPETLSRSQDK
jgi:hypothetical protein